MRCSISVSGRETPTHSLSNLLRDGYGNPRCSAACIYQFDIGQINFDGYAFAKKLNRYDHAVLVLGPHKESLHSQEGSPPDAHQIALFEERVRLNRRGNGADPANCFDFHVRYNARLPRIFYSPPNSRSPPDVYFSVEFRFEEQ